MDFLSTSRNARSKSFVFSDELTFLLELPNTTIGTFFSYISANNHVLHPVSGAPNTLYCLLDSSMLEMVCNQTKQLVVVSLQVNRAVSNISSSFTSGVSDTAISSDPRHLEHDHRTTVTVKLYLVYLSCASSDAPQMNALLQSVRKFVQHRFEEARVDFHRDFVWNLLSKERPYSQNLVKGHVTLQNLQVVCKLSYIRPGLDVDPQLHHVLSLHINWNRVMDQLKLIHAGQAHDLAEQGTRHLMLFHDSDAEVMLYVQIHQRGLGRSRIMAEASPAPSTDPVDVFLCRRLTPQDAGVVSESERQLLTLFVNTVVHWVWHDMVDN
eukprot:c7919_g1_i1.p1 GENE.c7919_g1_i1~~c7919_g1_i1.p1  ORF type:complete len:324 (+),score=63.52 c7919_g1_i1:2-973(+)